MNAHEIKGLDWELTILGKFHTNLKYRDKCSQQYLFAVNKTYEPHVRYPAHLELEITQITN